MDFMEPVATTLDPAVRSERGAGTGPSLWPQRRTGRHRAVKAGDARARAGSSAEPVGQQHGVRRAAARGQAGSAAGSRRAWQGRAAWSAHAVTAASRENGAKRPVYAEILKESVYFQKKTQEQKKKLPRSKHGLTGFGFGLSYSPASVCNRTKKL